VAPLALPMRISYVVPRDRKRDLRASRATRGTSLLHASSLLVVASLQAELDRHNRVETLPMWRTYRGRHGAVHEYHTSHSP